MQERPHTVACTRSLGGAEHVALEIRPHSSVSLREPREQEQLDQSHQLAERPPSPAREKPNSYTVQYIGIAQGELGVLAKRQVYPRRSRDTVPLPQADPQLVEKPRLPDVVEDSTASIRVPVNVFAGRRLRSCGATRPRRPPGPEPEHANTSSAGLPWRPFTPTSGGFPGWKLSDRRSRSDIKNEMSPSASGLTPKARQDAPT